MIASFNSGQQAYSQREDQIPNHSTKRVNDQIVNVKDSVGSRIDKEQPRDLRQLAKQREKKSCKHGLAKFEAKQKPHKKAKRNCQNEIQNNHSRSYGRAQQIGFKKTVKRNQLYLLAQRRYHVEISFGRQRKHGHKICADQIQYEGIYIRFPPDVDLFLF